MKKFRVYSKRHNLEVFVEAPTPQDAQACAAKEFGPAFEVTGKNPITVQETR